MVFGVNQQGADVLFKHLLCSLACAILLAACASARPPAPRKPGVTVAALMADAETEIKAGNKEQGVMLLKTASAAFPANTAPRLRMAQVQFDWHNYGEAIFHAQEVVDRDPDDLVAHSILAVSGLRVASKALTDLAAKNNMAGSVRAEAQDLAKLLRANIGGDIIPAVQPPAPKPSMPEEHP